VRTVRFSSTTVTLAPRAPTFAGWTVTLPSSRTREVWAMTAAKEDNVKIIIE